MVDVVKNIVTEAVGERRYASELFACNLDDISEYGNMLRTSNNGSDKDKEIAKQLNILYDVDKFDGGKIQKFVPDPVKFLITDISKTVTKLLGFLHSVVASPSDASKKAFMSEMDTLNLIGMAHKIMIVMEQDSTSPLKKMETAEDPFMNFAVYYKIIERYLSFFLFLEAFCHGLCNYKDMHRALKLKKMIIAFRNEAEDLDRLHQAENYYWPIDVEEIVAAVEKDANNKTNEQKADAIKKKLDLFHREMFLIAVWHDTKFEDLLWAETDDTLTWYRKDATNIVVFRSRQARYASKKEMEEFKKNVEKWKDFKNEGYFTYDGLETAVKKTFKNSSMLLLLKSPQGDKKLVVRSTKTEIHEHGPGWTLPTAKVVYQNPSGQEEIALVVGYK